VKGLPRSIRLLLKKVNPNKQIEPKINLRELVNEPNQHMIQIESYKLYRSQKDFHPTDFKLFF
jgi:hypothetical protein